MSGVATAYIGAAVIGGAISADAQRSSANKAADAQKAAAKASTDTQRYMFDKSLDITQPQRDMWNFASPLLQSYAYQYLPGGYNTGQQPSGTKNINAFPLSSQGNYVASPLSQTTNNGVPQYIDNPMYQNLLQQRDNYYTSEDEGGSANPFAIMGINQRLLNTPQQILNPDYKETTTQQQVQQLPNNLQGYIDQYNALDPRSGMPSTPTLQNSVDWNMESDPIYQAQKEEMLKTLNRRYSSMGRGASSDADNAVVNNQLALMQDSYGRSLADLERTNQNALTSYGLGYQQNADLYGRDTSRLMDMYNMQSGLDTTGYNRALDLAKIGAGAASSAGQNAMATGQGLSSAYQNQGNALAGINLNYGQQTSQNYQNTIAGILGGYNNYNLSNSMNSGNGLGLNTMYPGISFNY